MELGFNPLKYIPGFINSIQEIMKKSGRDYITKVFIHKSVYFLQETKQIYELKMVSLISKFGLFEGKRRGIGRIGLQLVHTHLEAGGG